MQSKGVVIAIISTIITVVVATTIVVTAVAVVAVAVGAFRSPLLGLLIPNVEVVIFDGSARCDSSGRDTPSTTDAGGPLDG
jgi:ABC-type enterochelin transport system permease subunit